jgi:hypothetical protein
LSEIERLLELLADEAFQHGFPFAIRDRSEIDYRQLHQAGGVDDLNCASVSLRERRAKNLVSSHEFVQTPSECQDIELAL